MLSGRQIVAVGCGDIGSEIVVELLRCGARVHVWDASSNALENLQRRCDNEFDDTAGPVAGRLETMVVDITDEASVSTAALRSLTFLDGVDGLVNSAAIVQRGTVEHTSYEQWARVIEINLSGVFLTCRALLPNLRVSGRGSIVNVSSISGLAGEAGIASYCASKFGIIGLSQALAREEGPQVRVNVICPGAIDTRMGSSVVAEYADRLDVPAADIRRQWIADTPAGRLGMPTDVAYAVSFLLSDRSTFMTAETMTVTGGARI